MAATKVKAPGFYWRKRLLATMTTTGYSLNNNVRPIQTQGGTVMPIAPAMGEIRLTEIIPVGGGGALDDLERILKQQEIDVRVVVGGKVHEGPMRGSTVEISGEVEGGVAMCNITMIGPPLGIIG